MPSMAQDLYLELVLPTMPPDPDPEESYTSIGDQTQLSHLSLSRTISNKEKSSCFLPKPVPKSVHHGVVTLYSTLQGQDTYRIIFRTLTMPLYFRPSPRQEPHMHTLLTTLYQDPHPMMPLHFTPLGSDTSKPVSMCSLPMSYLETSLHTSHLMLFLQAPRQESLL